MGTREGTGKERAPAHSLALGGQSSLFSALSLTPKFADEEALADQHPCSRNPLVCPAPARLLALQVLAAVLLRDLGFELGPSCQKDEGLREDLTKKSP